MIITEMVLLTNGQVKVELKEVEAGQATYLHIRMSVEEARLLHVGAEVELKLHPREGVK